MPCFSFFLLTSLAKGINFISLFKGLDFGYIDWLLFFCFQFHYEHYCFCFSPFFVCMYECIYLFDFYLSLLINLSLVYNFLLPQKVYLENSYFLSHPTFHPFLILDLDTNNMGSNSNSLRKLY